MEPEADTRTVCVNLGCGANIKESNSSTKWINLDMFNNEGVDVVQNLEDGLPCFEDDSVDLIFASHVLEHIKEWINLMKECCRVLKPKGILYLRVPEARCRAAIADPTHCNLFVNETWFHFDSTAKIGFDTLGVKEDLGFRIKWNETIGHYRNVIDDGVPGGYFTELVIDLEKIGDDYPWQEFATKEVVDKVSV
jgi:predicted SAM-dependent methyltransferase